MTKRKITFGSLFSGIGGLDLGLELAGMDCLWQVEKDKFCQEVLKKHWPYVEKFEDVKDVGIHNLKPVDVICGGFPCQPHSLAGKRKGAKDDRNLWPEYFRIVREIRPLWVIGENVPGIKTTILDNVLSDLESIGYKTRTFIIPACAIGAPHIRERVFILADADGTGFSQRETEKPEKSKKLETAFRTSIRSGGWWNVEPALGRVANGVPHRVDRIRSLGNAVVPGIAEWVGSIIVDVIREK